MAWLGEKGVEEEESEGIQCEGSGNDGLGGGVIAIRGGGEGGGLASYRGIFPDIIKLVVPRETRVKVTAVENAQESTNKLYNKFFFKTVREIIILFTKILSLSLRRNLPSCA